MKASPEYLELLHKAYSDVENKSAQQEPKGKLQTLDSYTSDYME